MVGQSDANRWLRRSGEDQTMVLLVLCARANVRLHASHATRSSGAAISWTWLGAVGQSSRWMRSGLAGQAALAVIRASQIQARLLQQPLLLQWGRPGGASASGSRPSSVHVKAARRRRRMSAPRVHSRRASRLPELTDVRPVTATVIRTTFTIHSRVALGRRGRDG